MAQIPISSIGRGAHSRIVADKKRAQQEAEFEAEQDKKLSDLTEIVMQEYTSKIQNTPSFKWNQKLGPSAFGSNADYLSPDQRKALAAADIAYKEQVENWKNAQLSRIKAGLTPGIGNSPSVGAGVDQFAEDFSARPNPFSQKSRTINSRFVPTPGVTPGTFTGPIQDSPVRQVQGVPGSDANVFLQNQQDALQQDKKQEAADKSYYLTSLQNPDTLTEYDYQQILDLSTKDKQFALIAQSTLQEVADTQLLDYQRDVSRDVDTAEISPTLLAITGRTKDMSTLRQTQARVAEMVDVLRTKYHKLGRAKVYELEQALYSDSYSGQNTLGAAIKELDSGVTSDILKDILSVNGWVGADRRSILNINETEPGKALQLAMRKNAGAKKKGTVPWFPNGATENQKLLSRKIDKISAKDFSVGGQLTEFGVGVGTGSENAVLAMELKSAMAQISEQQPDADAGEVWAQFETGLPQLLDDYTKALQNKTADRYPMAEALAKFSKLPYERPKHLLSAAPEDSVDQKAFMPAYRKWIELKRAQGKTKKDGSGVDLMVPQTFDELKRQPNFISAVMKEPEFNILYEESRFNPVLPEDTGGLDSTLTAVDPTAQIGPGDITTGITGKTTDPLPAPGQPVPPSIRTVTAEDAQVDEDIKTLIQQRHPHSTVKEALQLFTFYKEQYFANTTQRSL